MNDFSLSNKVRAGYGIGDFSDRIIENMINAK